jgi:hypothetical protein
MREGKVKGCRGVVRIQYEVCGCGIALVPFDELRTMAVVNEDGVVVSLRLE